MYRLSARSRARLQGVHPDLIRVAEAALARSRVDFAILEGLRTVARQRELVAKGASTTMNSRHITGHAVDVGAFVGPQLRWDMGLYYQIAEAWRDASEALGVPIRWGGAWVRLTPDVVPEVAVMRYVERCRAEKRRPLVDAVHFELPAAQYPG